MPTIPQQAPRRAPSLSAFAFTVCLAVWMILSIIGSQLSGTLFDVLGPAILAGLGARLLLGTDHLRRLRVRSLPLLTMPLDTFGGSSRCLRAPMGPLVVIAAVTIYAAPYTLFAAGCQISAVAMAVTAALFWVFGKNGRASGRLKIGQWSSRSAVHSGRIAACTLLMHASDLRMDRPSALQAA